MFLFKSSILSISVIIFLSFDLSSFANKVITCINDINSDFSKKPDDKNFTNYIFKDIEQVDIKTVFGKMYLVYISDNYFPAKFLLPGKSYCDKFYHVSFITKLAQAEDVVGSENKDCIGFMNSAGFTINSPEHTVKNAVLNTKYAFFQRPEGVDLLSDYQIALCSALNQLREYIDYIIKNLHIQKFMHITEYCEGLVKDQVTICVADINEDLKGTTVEVTSKYAMKNLKTTDLLTLYGQIYYIELQDNIVPNANIKFPQQFCKTEFSDEFDDCLACLDDLNYDVTNPDSHFAVMHTFYYIGIDEIQKLNYLPDKNKIKYLRSYMDHIVERFEISGVQPAYEFCLQLIQYDTPHFSIYPFK